MRPATVIVLGLLALGCTGASTLELVLIHDDTLVPSRDLTTAEVAFFDFGDPMVTGDESFPVRWRGTAEELLAGAAVPDLDLLIEGHQYVAVAVFGASSGCIAADRVVGRSLVFDYDGDTERISVAVGCANEIQPTRLRPETARLAHGLVSTDDGAILLGGAERLDPALAPVFWRDEVLPIERYDIRTGAFTEVGALATGRVGVAAVRLRSGEVAAIGGFSPSTTECTDTQAIVWPAARDDLAALPTPRCAPGAAVIDNGNVVVHGGQPTAPTLSTFDPELRTLVDDGAMTSGPRGSPQLLPLGDAVLSIGGDGFGTPGVEILLPGCGASDSPCSIEVPVAAAADPGPGWVGMTGGIVPCVEGGDVATGALYVTGGGVRPAAGEEPTVTLDTIYCTLITEDIAAWELRSVGALPAPRRDHETLVVSDGGGISELLIVGGLGDGSSVDDATRVEVRGCTCTVVEARDVPTRGAPPLVLHAAVPLADATVLVVGGGRVNFVDSTVDATAWAGLYFPDLVLP